MPKEPMTRNVKELRRECHKASFALMDWFESQEIDTQQAIGTMAITAAAMIVEQSAGDLLRASDKLLVVHRLTKAMVLSMMSREG